MLGNNTLQEIFTSENPEFSHLNIFGCHVYLHVPKDKISKLDRSGNKGIFVGYSDQSKAYIIYIPGFLKFEVISDVTFDEDATFNKSKKTHVDEEEQETPRIIEINKSPVRDDKEELIPEDQDMAEP